MKKILKRAVYLLSVLILINPAFSQEKQSPSDSTQTEIIEKKPAAENGKASKRNRRRSGFILEQALLFPDRIRKKTRLPEPPLI